MKVEPQVPYVGLRPFQQSERSIFVGRYRETRAIVDRIFVNRLVVIYGQSGTGKTSLLHAGIIPQLEKEGFEVLPLARVRGTLPRTINVEEIQNFYTFNCIREFVGDEAVLKQLTKQTLAECFKERPHAVDSLGQPLLRAFILDQVEGMFAALPQYWQQREPFFRQLHDALEQDHLLRIVLCIREDALGSLESYSAFLPDKPQTRFRLERMRKEDALSALIEPLKETGVSFEPAAAHMIVDELSKIRVETFPGQFDVIPGEFIEPVQLQVVAQKLWESLPAGKKVITQRDIETLPSTEDVLSSFYDHSLREIVSQPDIDESTVRNWFERALITSNGIRNTVLQGREETGGLPNRVVDQFVNKHIIRIAVRNGANWYELAHDRFIQPILQSNRKYRSNAVI